MNCFIPCDLAPGLSLPYPSSRLMTPHAASPAPMAQTSVFKVVIAVVKNPICETKITDFAYFVVLRRIPKRKEACFVIFTSPQSLRLWYLLHKYHCLRFIPRSSIQTSGAGSATYLVVQNCVSLLPKQGARIQFFIASPP